MAALLRRGHPHGMQSRESPALKVHLATAMPRRESVNRDGTAKLAGDYLSDRTRRHGLGDGATLYGGPGEALALG
jgi:hypothetical protein